MPSPVIEVRDLGKRYRLGGPRLPYRTLRETLAGLFARGKPAAADHPGDSGTNGTFWALRDVSFDVHEGEVLGVIGHNGAGKTTLLRLLSRITEPTTGGFRIRGRVGSLLEVGTGFHPELTGRENIFLSGAILGMTSREIARKFDEIVAFAEVEKFIDTPVKHYSSGMYLRLAFAVAAHLEPEILLVDEVLAVGDAAFQKKCLGKMHDVAGAGRTVLFVSHNLAAVENLCDRVIWIDQGRLYRDGDGSDIIGDYLRQHRWEGDSHLITRKDRRGNGALRLTAARICDRFGQAGATVVSGGGIGFVFDFEVAPGADASDVIIKVSIRDRCGRILFVLANRLSGEPLRVSSRKGQFLCSVPRLPLNADTFVLDIVAKLGGDVADEVHDALRFSVMSADVFGSGNIPLAKKHGPIYVEHSWNVRSTQGNATGGHIAPGAVSMECGEV